MSMARLVITAVTIEGRSKSEVAREYGVSRVWVQKLIHRFEADGEAAFEPRSRRPHSNPYAVDLGVEDQIVRLRKQLSKDGLDAGAETIAAHLQISGVSPVPAVSTIWRVLSRRGFMVGQPQKRPRSSWHRFCAEQPNERWQADITHWRLADGAEVEILNILDDHSRVNIAAKARRITLGPQVVDTFTTAFGRWGVPASVLTDNRGGIHRPAARRGPGRAGGPARTARDPAAPLPAVPSADLRQGRTVPSDPEEMAAGSAPGRHSGRAATPAEPVPDLLQHRPAASRVGPAHPPPRPIKPGPKPFQAARSSPPTAGSDTTRST